jgi:toxin ParE1/3/4
VIRIVISDEAQADALNAFSFYEERRRGLGERFRDHLDHAIGSVQRSPERYPEVYRDLRRRLVERFPYAIFYRIYPGVVLIVALMHAKQNPRTWQRRAGGNEPG